VTRDDLREVVDHPNVRAFLKAIRLGEGTSDAKGYQRIVGGGEFRVPPWAHPERPVYIPSISDWSTAAGAYQFLAKTWKGLVKKYGFEDFSPASQDEAAVGLIAGRGALDDVLAGNIETAIWKCRQEWASLPGSAHGQRTEPLARVLAEYKANGGTIA